MLLKQQLRIIVPTVTGRLVRFNNTPANIRIYCNIEYIIFDACGLFVKKNSGSFSAALPAL